MSETPRTFRIPPGKPLMRGEDIGSWQHEIVDHFATMDIQWPASAAGPTGVYDTVTRSATASLCKALGILHEDAMAEGVTPELRTKIRHRRLTLTEQRRRLSPALVRYRRALRRRHAASSGGRLHPLTAQVHADSWGWHPPVHDGIDIITPPAAIFYAPVAGEIIRADIDGWWGKGAPSNIQAPAAGIVVLRVTEDVGPFRKNMRLCFGHCGPVHGIKVGVRVEAGQAICRDGLANAWHTHFMVHDRADARGVGDRDPRPFYDAAQAAR